jgi:hypothetical protein
MQRDGLIIFGVLRLDKMQLDLLRGINRFKHLGAFTVKRYDLAICPLPCKRLYADMIPRGAGWRKKVELVRLQPRCEYAAEVSQFVLWDDETSNIH